MTTLDLAMLSGSSSAIMTVMRDHYLLITVVDAVLIGGVKQRQSLLSFPKY